MSEKKYRGMTYHQWNPYTPMDTFENYFGFGPTILVRGEGNYVFNSRGKRFILANSGAWNFALGYGREEIIEAACSQMRELPFSSSWGLTHPKAIALAEKLVKISSGNFTRAYLTSDGTEAVEAAMKMARQYHHQSPDPGERRRRKIISLRGAYHGYSFADCSAAGNPDLEAKYGPLMPGFAQIEPACCYRCPYGKTSYPECGMVCADALEQKILEEDPQTVAAFVYEPIMGEHGVITPPDEYHMRVAEICRKYGLLLIADEVTTGFGRAGKLFFSQDWAIQPDILCLGKIISGGYLPLGATLASKAVFQRFLGADAYFMHGSTNSGHPVCAAVGLAAIEIILRENLAENAAGVGARLKAGLERLAERHEIIGDVRGRGLMLQIELVKDRKTKEPFSFEERLYMLLDAAERGLLTSLEDFRIFPPLTIDVSLADEIVSILDKALRCGALAKISRTARIAKEFAVSKMKS
jgi:adenosylmethionine-8-amino-7-oxononanoate aminotransferase